MKHGNWMFFKMVQTSVISFKHFYRNFFRNNFYSRCKSTTSQQPRRLIGLLKDWNWWKSRRVLHGFLHVNRSRVFSDWTHLKTVEWWKAKGASRLGRETVSISNSKSSQRSSNSSKSVFWYPVKSVSFAPTLEKNSYRISIVPFWSRIFATLTEWMPEISCFCWLASSMKGKFALFHGISRFFTVRVTESAPKFGYRR